MDKSTQRVPADQAKCPEKQQDYEYRPKHDGLLVRLWIIVPRSIFSLCIWIALLFLASRAVKPVYNYYAPGGSAGSSAFGSTASRAKPEGSPDCPPSNCNGTCVFRRPLRRDACCPQTQRPKLGAQCSPAARLPARVSAQQGTVQWSPRPIPRTSLKV